MRKGIHTNTRKGVSGRLPEPRAKNASPRAFTLVEVLFGIALLGVMAMTFGATFPLAARMQDGARARAQAIRLARREMEALRQIPFADLQSASGANNGQLAGESIPVVDGVPPAGQGFYTFTNVGGSDSVGALMPIRTVRGTGGVVTATPTGIGRVWIEDAQLSNPNGSALSLSTTPTTLRRVTVQVSWADRTGSHTINLESLIANVK